MRNALVLSLIVFLVGCAELPPQQTPEAVARQNAASKAMNICGTAKVGMVEAKKMKIYSCIKDKTEKFYTEELKEQQYRIAMQDPAFNYCVNSGFLPSTEAFATCLSGTNQARAQIISAQRSLIVQQPVTPSMYERPIRTECHQALGGRIECISQKTGLDASLLGQIRMP